VIVTVLPETVAGPETIRYVTASPEEAVALTVNGASPTTFAGIAGNVITWFALATVRFWETTAAAL
jgi:hypothetical protein